MLLSSCATIGGETRRGVNQAACIAFHPVYISCYDVLTDETARQILSNNVIGEELCRWKNESENHIRHEGNKECPVALSDH